MSTKKEQIFELLAKGVAQHKVPAIVGVSASYVSQLLMDEQFTQELAEARTETALARREHDDAMDELETLTLSKLAEAIEFETKTAPLLKAFQTLNNAKRRTMGEAHEQASAPSITVNIRLPDHLRTRTVQHDTNANNEVIEVEGRAITTMPSNSVLGMIDRGPEAIEHKEPEMTLDNLGAGKPILEPTLPEGARRRIPKTPGYKK